MLIILLVVTVALNAAGFGSSVLPIEQGTYVSETATCKGAPLAETQIVDNFGVQYPHLWGCKARIMTHKGANYYMNQTCSGGEHDRIFLTVLAHDRYSVGKGKSRQVFRFCSTRPQTQ